MIAAPDRRAFLTVLVGATGALFLPHPARAQGATYQGDFEQGGMIVGRTEPGARVTLDGQAVRLSDEGVFVFGFGRDAPESARLVVKLRGGEAQSETLKIEKRTYDIQRIDGLPDSQVTPPDSAVERINRDNRLIGAARSFDTHETWFSYGLDWPVIGPLTGFYGSQRILNGEPRRPHFGVDIAKGEGEPIHAPQRAIVRMAEADMYFTGGTTILDHGGGITTSYLHQSRLDVKVDDMVEKGQIIGLIGKTGRATGPHLCWRLNWFQERLDPQLVAPPMPG